MSGNEEFYVGYHPQAPAGIGRFLRTRITGLILLVALVGAGLAALQNPFPVKVFEWGVPREFVGLMQTKPYPELLVRRPGTTTANSSDSQWSRYSLVAQGKMGADELVAGNQGKWVTVRGSLIYRGGQTMIEVAPGGVQSVESTGDPATAVVNTGDFENLGTHTLVGEIVDSKCWLGVMAPGSTKPHRACAARCISGGIPPVLLVRGADGSAVYLQLASHAGEAVNQDVLPYVAEIVEITGEIYRDGQRLILQFNPEGIRRTS